MINVKKIVAKSKKYIYGDLLGEHNSKIIGDGYDFAKVRPYLYGEHIRRVDPFATAKTGEIYLRDFYESKEINVEVVILSSGTLYFGSKILKQEVVASLAYEIGLETIKNSDRVALSIFSNKLDFRLNPTKKEGILKQGVEKFLGDKLLSKSINYDKLLEFLLHGIKKRSYLFLIGDFYEIPKLKAVSKKHEVIVIKVRDRFEINPKPIGEIGAIDPQNLKKRTLLFSQSNLNSYKKSMRKNDLKLKSYLKSCSIRLLLY